MDEMDHVQDACEQFNNFALAEQQRHRLTPSEGRVNGSSRRECEDCDTDIPLKRREAQPGCTRCIHCQTEFEALLITGQARRNS